ncbi:hypothetical protein [Mucilaginibacter defluvii]|uniref:Tail tape measure protein n=1 Tax=Mucilaginibacter defluvii TaxID=1196019 RepID=A0ABP9FKT7_9SPHI
MANNGGNTQQSNVLINIGVQGQQQIQAATQQVQQLNNTAQRTGQANMAAPVRTLRQQLRDANNDLQRMASLGQQNTAQFAQTASRVAQLRNDIDEVNNSISNFNGENRFKVFANFASAGAKALQGYTGAMAFLGVESDDAAKTIAKLQGLMAFNDALTSLDDIVDNFKDLGRLLGITTTATQAQTQAQNVQAAASTAQATATQGVTAANNTATASAITLRGALSAIGIGLLISAVAYLVTNWDNLKASVQKLIPALNDTKGGFDKIMQVIYGVGNVIINVLKAPIDALILQFKVLYRVMTGDFKGAIAEFKEGANQLVNDFNVISNYQSGVASKLADQREAHRKEQLTKEVENLKNRIEIQKAAGKDVTKLQQLLYKDQLELAKGNEEETKKLKQEYAVAQAAEQKKRNDEAKALAKKYSDDAKAKLKADLDELKKQNDDAKKIVTDSSKSQRDIELENLDIKYKKEFTLLEKRKKDIKDYNQQFKTLTEARKAEEAVITKKYDDLIKAYDDEVQTAYLNSYEKRAIEINKKADELLKNATPQQQAIIQQDRFFQLNQNTAEAKASSTSNKAQTDLAIAEDINRPSETDTPDEARIKVENLAKARFDAENAAFELKRTQLEGQQEEIELLTAEHNKTLTDTEKEAADAKKQIAQAEFDNKLKMYDAVGAAAGTASEILGQNTLAGKSLAVASSLINTYSAIAGQLRAFAGVPIPGYAIAQAIATGAVGFEQVRKIIDTKVPTVGGGTGGGSVTAPVINSQVINRENNGTNEIRQSIDNTAKQTRNIRAYIVDKDLEKQKSKTNYFNSQSTI